jgi:RNA polymerase sigma-54 factor
MDIRTIPQQIQKTILAPVMQKSIQVLLLPRQDLNLAIEQELLENPALDIVEEGKEEENIERYKEDHIERLLEEYPYRSLGAGGDDPGVEEQDEDRGLAKRNTLEEDLFNQLCMELNDSLDLKIGEYIIGNLNEDGYLKITFEEIAHALAIEDIAQIQRVLDVVQSFEPIGIASFGLKDCLCRQIRHRFPDDGEFLLKIVEDHLQDLGERKFDKIARATGSRVEEVKKVAQIIRLLEPRPARNYRPIGGNIYIEPDVYVLIDDDGHPQIRISDDGLPSLRVSPVYKKMLRNKNMTNEEKEFVRQKLNHAVSFIKSVEQRSQTIREIVEFIVKRQKDFFTNGPSFLVPMVLRDVAKEIDRNESTISRAIHHKYIDTPHGTFPLKFFFSQSLNNDENGSVANRSIKEAIKEMIAQEDQSAPVSDQAIQTYFKNKGIRVARRTISKYRQALKILPARLRKQ